MKKLLLPAALIFASLATFGQTQNCKVGVATNADTSKYIGFYQDFTSTDDYFVSATTPGIFPWGDTLQGGPNDENPNFYSPFEKTPGKITYWVTQYEGEFVPFGIAFGDIIDTVGGVVDTTHLSIDLSGNKTFEVGVSNLSTSSSPDSTIFFRISLQDVNGKTLDTYASYADDGNPRHAYMYTIQDTINPGVSDVFSGTFEGAYKANYPYTFDYDTQKTGCPDNVPTLDQTFDFTQVTGVLFTVVSKQGDAATSPGKCYYQLPVTSLPISIDYVRVGACPVPTGTGITKARASVNNVMIQPNPATDRTTVNYATSSSNVVVKVSNMTGMVVRTVNGNASTASFSVADLPQGLYIVTVEVDGAPASTQRLMVR